MKYIPEFSEKEIGENNRIFRERYAVYKEKGLDFLKSRENILGKAGNFREKVLDIGSGRGVTVLALAEAGYNVTTVDNNEEMLRMTALNLAGRGLLPKAEIYRMDAYSLGFPDGSFNTVFAVEALHHLDDTVAFLEETDRVLKAGGKMVLADFNDRGREIVEAVHAGEGHSHDGDFSGREKAVEWLTGQGYKVKQYDDECHWIIVGEKM